MSQLTDPIQREGLESFCETVVGGFLASHPAVTVSLLVDRLDQRIALLEAGIRRPVRSLVRQLAVPGGMWNAGGGLSRFSRLPSARREETVRRLLAGTGRGQSGIAQSLYRQVVFVACTLVAEQGGFPAAPQPIPVEGPGGNQFETATLKPGQTQLACDWLVIGSGPAGSVMAAELAETGQQVLLVDQGSLLPDGLRLGEAEASRRIIETFGAWTPQKEAVVISAGRTFGGGSVVGWGTCLDPPQELLEEWSRSTGCGLSGSGDFQHSLFAVRRRLFVDPTDRQNPGDRALKAGADRLGIDLEATGNNTAGCGECRGCQFGCSTGLKKDMRASWLIDAARLGVFLLPNCRVRRLQIHGGVAQAAEAELVGGGAEPRPVRIVFRRCVLAAGAIHSPAILIRSGFCNPHLGKHLALHPSVIVPSVHREPQDHSGGPLQAWVCGKLKEREGGGVILENSFFPPGLAGLTLPWRSGSEFAAMLAAHRHWNATLVLARDRQTGRVFLDPEGKAAVDYRLGRLERESLNAGVDLAWQLAIAGGADAAYGPWWDFGAETARPDRKVADRGAVGARDRLLRSRVRAGLKLWSAHQMGTCRMADSPGRGVVGPGGQVFGLRNVFACDSSVFPSAAGVNPMVTVCALSHFLAQRIKADSWAAG